MHRRALVFFPCFIACHRCEKSARESQNCHHLITQHDNIHARTNDTGPAGIYDVKMAQFVLKIEKLSHIIGALGSQDLRSVSSIMAPAYTVHSVFPSSCAAFSQAFAVN